MGGLLLGSSMGSDEKSLGKALMQIGGFITVIPLWAEMVDELWFLFIIGPVLFISGALIHSGQSRQSLHQSAIQGITPHLPTSKGVDVLETFVGFADNPDTAVVAVAKQPEGTRPVMSGIHADEFISELGSYGDGYNQGDYSYQTGNYMTNSNSADFLEDQYDEFSQHGHERVLPLEDREPVACWSNPVDEWQNPTKYW